MIDTKKARQVRVIDDVPQVIENLCVEIEELRKFIKKECGPKMFSISNRPDIRKAWHNWNSKAARLAGEFKI